MIFDITHKHLKHFDPHTLLIAATRYYMGRRTIVTGSFAEELANSWEDIPEKTRNIIQKDLETEFKQDDLFREKYDDDSYRPLGDDCDRKCWEKVRKKYKG